MLRYAILSALSHVLWLFMVLFSCCGFAYLYQEPRGGAAIYSAGTTVFHGKADFLGNGQYDADANGYEPSNEDGGALSNSGSMTVSDRRARKVEEECQPPLSSRGS